MIIKDLTQYTIVAVFGSVAVIVAILAFLPQSLKTIKTKKTNGISWVTFTIYTLANTLWVVWASCDLAYQGTMDATIVMKDSIMIIANTPCALWSGIILGIKLYNMYAYGEDCKKWVGKNKTKKSANNFASL